MEIGVFPMILILVTVWLLGHGIAILARGGRRPSGNGASGGWIGGSGDGGSDGGGGGCGGGGGGGCGGGS
ncbi:hypothetical protein GCM10022245_20670 [Streptomyces mayteni]